MDSTGAGSKISCVWFLPSLVAAAAKSLQSCPTLCDPIDGGPPGYPIPGILQARTLEWVAISFSNAWKGKVKVKSLSPVRLFATPWSAAYQAPLSMGFSRQEYWSGVPLPRRPHTVLQLHGSWGNCSTWRDQSHDTQGSGDGWSKSLNQQSRCPDLAKIFLSNVNLFTWKVFKIYK